MTNPDVTLELLEEIVAAFNAKDVEAIVGHFEDDGEMLLAAGPDNFGLRLKGKEALREGLSQRFAAVPDIQWGEGSSWIAGDRAVSEWRVTGTLPDGNKLDCLGCDLWLFKSGKIVKKDTYYKQVTG